MSSQESPTNFANRSRSTSQSLAENPSTQSSPNSLYSATSAVTRENTPSPTENCEGVCESLKCLVNGDGDSDSASAQQSIEVARNYQLSKLLNNITQTPRLSIISSDQCPASSSRVNTGPCNTNTNNNMCANHGLHSLYFCITCEMPICPEDKVDHSGHQCTLLTGALESARATNLRLKTRANLAIMDIRQAFQEVERTLRSVHIKKNQAVEDIQRYIKQLISAINNRETALLNIVEHSCNCKDMLLKLQRENFLAAFQSLSSATSLLNDFKDSSNTYELIGANKKAENQLKQICSLQSELSPCEDDAIIFIPPPDNDLVRKINAFGKLNLSRLSVFSSELMATHSLIRSHIPYRLNEALDRLDATKARPIYGLSNTIIVKKTPELPSFSFGKEGNFDGELCRPWGVCCDRRGRIIVADRSNNRIQVFERNGTFLFKFGTLGSGPGQLDRPAGVTVNPQGNILVADKDNHRIQIFSEDGIYMYAFGTKGSAIGQFNYPWDVACNSSGQIAVSDTRNRRIQFFTAEGVFVNKFGFEGPVMWKYFDSPRSVCFTRNGSLIVSDFNNHRLVIIDLNSMEPFFLGREGSGEKEFLRPQGIVCDDDGNIIVADSKNNRIQVIDYRGRYLYELGQRSNDLSTPSGISLTADGRIVVVDFGRNRIVIY